MLSLSIRQLWFFTSALFSRAWIILCFLVIDLFYNVHVSAEWSVNVAVIGILSFMLMAGGGVAVFRESALDAVEGKKRLYSHAIIGLILCVIVMFFYHRFEVLILALIASQLDLLEARYKGLDKHVAMTLSQLLKPFLILLALLSIHSMLIFIVVAVTIEILVICWIMNESSSYFLYPLGYSYQNIAIGILAWIVNSSDKVIASWYLPDRDLRTYSLTYFSGYFILFGSSLFANISSKKFIKTLHENNLILFTKYMKTYMFWLMISIAVLALGTRYYEMDWVGGLIILVSSTFIGLYSIGQLEHVRNGSLRIILVINLIAGIINLVLNILFLPIYGRDVLYYSSILTSGFMFVSLILSQKRSENIS